MPRLFCALALMAALAAVQSAQAQEPFGGQPSPSDLQVEQNPQYYMMLKMMERYDDPHQAVRRKAEQKAAERRGRLASQKWYGYSPLRPTTNVVPWMSSYGQHWIGNGYNPDHWVGRDYAPTALLIETVQR
ncbi:MAG: hypothetical protein KDB14_05310 [Planctomycetales bacterium]|nr:hypothetical protein [Planctomycetales bacterium]